MISLSGLYEDSLPVNSSLVLAICLTMVSRVEHHSQGTMYTSTTGGRTRLDISYLFETLAQYQQWTYTLQDRCVQGDHISPSLYLLLVGGSSVDDILQNVKDHLKVASCNPTLWRPEFRLVAAVPTSLPKELHFSIAFSIFHLLWEKMVYNAAVIILEHCHDQGYIYLADPFDERNSCGRNLTSVYLAQNCTKTSAEKYLYFSTTHNRKTFPKCRIVASFRQYAPFSLITNNKKKLKGTEVKILQTIREKTGLQITWRGRPRECNENRQIDIDTNIKNLSSKKIDIAIGGSIIDFKYYYDVKYLQFHATQYLRFFVADSSRVNGWRILCMMFPRRLWTCIVVTALICVVILHFFRRVIRKFRRRSPERDFFDSFLTVFSLLLEVPADIPQRLSLRIFFMSLILPLYGLSSLYSTFLHSLTINPPYYPNVETIEELLDSNLSIHGLDITHDHYRDLMESSDFQTLIHRFKTSNRTLREESGLLERSRNFAILSLDTVMSYILADEGYNIHYVRYDLAQVNMAMIAPKGSLYLKRFNHYVEASVEHGLYERWELELFGKRETKLRRRKKGPISLADGPRVLQVSDLQSAFMILLFGNLISSVVFVIELLADYKKRNTYPIPFKL